MNRNQRRRNGQVRQAKQRGPATDFTFEQFYGPRFIWPEGKDNQELRNHKAAHLAGELIGLTLGAPFWEDCAVCVFKHDMANGMSEEGKRRALYDYDVDEVPTRKEIEMGEVNETQDGNGEEVEAPSVDRDAELTDEGSVDGSDAESEPTSGDESEGDAGDGEGGAVEGEPVPE